MRVSKTSTAPHVTRPGEHLRYYKQENSVEYCEAVLAPGGFWSFSTLSLPPCACVVRRHGPSCACRTIILHGHGGGDDDEEMPDISSISIPTPKKGRGRPKKNTWRGGSRVKTTMNPQSQGCAEYYRRKHQHAFGVSARLRHSDGVGVGLGWWLKPRLTVVPRPPPQTLTPQPELINPKPP